MNRALSPHSSDGCRGSAVIVSDYDKGVVNRELLPDDSAGGPRRAGVPVFLDPKVHHADYYVL